MASRGGIGSRLYRGDVSVDFVGRQRLWYMISGAILVISVVAVVVFGLNFSVDFKGGSVYQFAAGSSTISQVRQTVSGAGGGSDTIVQKITPLGGSGSKWQVQTHPLSVAQRNSVESAISHRFGIPQNAISVTYIGASWGSQITKKAAEALIAFLVVIVIYLSIAFEWKMAVAALVALAHDIVITIGVYALAHFQVSPASVIGLLTILGYSLYDTVVVFDKVRENTAGLLASTRSTYSQAANQALNQTLVRSINTSLVALLPVASILFVGAGFLGAGELRDLALVLFVGMLSGTYSSICIATPVLADLKEREPQYKALAKRVQLRASGGRAAQRAAAKAAAVAKPASSRRGRAAVSGPEEPDLAVTDAGDTGPGLPDQAGDEAEDTGAVTPGEPVAAGASQPGSRSGPRPGPRQQPRRSSAAKRRPSGKKRRR
jgi:preprotein translocase subunit SecF